MSTPNAMVRVLAVTVILVGPKIRCPFARSGRDVSTKKSNRSLHRTTHHPCIQAPNRRGEYHDTQPPESERMKDRRKPPERDPRSPTMKQSSKSDQSFKHKRVITKAHLPVLDMTASHKSSNAEDTPKEGGGRNICQMFPQMI